MKIQVIKLKGGRASFSDYAARWAFRMIDIYSGRCLGENNRKHAKICAD